MKMHRRDFLRRFAAATAAATAAAATLDPERLLWTPGEKTIFLPPDGGWTSAIVQASELPPGVSYHYKNLGGVTMPDGKTHVVTTVAHTSMGTAEFDSHGNLLRLGGRVITSAQEHTMYEGKGYSAGRVNMGGEDQRLARHIVRRQRAGVYDEPSAPIRLRRRPAADYDWRG